MGVTGALARGLAVLAMGAYAAVIYACAEGSATNAATALCARAFGDRPRAPGPAPPGGAAPRSRRHPLADSNDGPLR